MPNPQEAGITPEMLQALAAQYGIKSQADLQQAIQMLAQNPELLQQLMARWGMNEGGDAQSQGGVTEGEGEDWIDQQAARSANLRPAAPPLEETVGEDDEEDDDDEEE